MIVLENARVMTCDPARPGLGIIERGAVAFGDTITWVGDRADRPRSADEIRIDLAGAAVPDDGGAAGQGVNVGEEERLLVINAGGRLVTPGLIDCHTHAIFAGDRANEFALRAAGASYLEIAAAGGGIGASLGPTRAASDGALIASLHARLDAALAGGTTTIEVKTGYDLTVDGELRLLRCIAAAAATRAQRIVPTLLAHVVPSDRRDQRAAYVDELCRALIPAAAAERLAASVDVYCDEGAFTLAETQQIFAAARAAGLAVRGHAGQFRDLGAAELIAEHAGRSADHLEQLTDGGAHALARAGTVAVMLPGACVQLRLPVPPIERLRRAGVAMAIGSDLNPGSSYCETLPIQMWLATTHFAMTVEETWLGVTRHAARAVGAAAGTIAPGVRGDMLVWDCDEPAAIPYRYGAAHRLLRSVYVAGTPALTAS